MCKTAKYARSVKGTGRARSIVLALLERRDYFEVIPLTKDTFDVRVKTASRSFLDGLGPGGFSKIVKEVSEIASID